MAKKPKSSARNIAHGPDILVRHLHMGTWKQRQREKRKGSSTPGRTKRSDTCQLSPIAGKPRKSFLRARAYKDAKSYSKWCKEMDKVN